MKEADYRKFFDDHKQTVQDNGFSDRLFATLDCLPAPVVKKDKSKIIILAFALTGILIFILLGGYAEVISGLASFGGAVADTSLLTPEIIISFILAVISVFAVSKIALDQTN
jgi:hypothetical protein